MELILNWKKKSEERESNKKSTHRSIPNNHCISDTNALFGLRRTRGTRGKGSSWEILINNGKRRMIYD